MSNRMKRHVRPLSLAAVLAVIGVMAALIALSPAPNAVEAQGLCDTATGATKQALIDSGVCPADGNGGGGGGDNQGSGDGLCDTATGATKQALIDSGVCPAEEPAKPTPTAPPAPAVAIGGWSSSGGGSETLVIQATNQGAMGIDDSIVLVLDDKFTVPGSVPTGTVFFKEPSGPSGGARVNASVVIDEEDDDLTGDDSHTIRIYVPDMDPADDKAQGITASRFGIVIDKAAGIKNPTEGEKTYAIGYQVLKGTDGYDSAGTQMFAVDDSASLGTLTDSKVAVRAKASLDDKNNKRGYELTITGSGFNKASNATAYVLKGQNTAPDCATVVADGESIGSGTVGDDHKVVITAEVTGGSKGDFSPGNTNYICIRDDNAPTRRISSAAKAFELEHSVAVEPAEVASGEEVTVKLRDYPASAMVTNVSLDGKRNSSAGDFAATRSGSEITFDMPGGVSGTVEVAVVANGASTKTTTITVDPASLSLSQTEVAPNASIIISGSGFNEGSEIPVGNIEMDDEPLVVDDAGTQSCSPQQRRMRQGDQLRRVHRHGARLDGFEFQRQPGAGRRRVHHQGEGRRRLRRQGQDHDPGAHRYGDAGNGQPPGLHRDQRRELADQHRR